MFISIDQASSQFPLQFRTMPAAQVSQKTIVEVMRLLRTFALHTNPDFTELCYENNFPGWFVIHAESHYGWGWRQMLIDLRSSAFFFPSESILGDSIVGEYLTEGRAAVLGEALLQRLAALSTTLPGGEEVLRSLQLDGFDVNRTTLSLVPLEGPVSAAEEEGRLHKLVKSTGLPSVQVLLKHMEDAHSLYTSGQYHSSLNESRNIVQALLDGISEETNKSGKHSHSHGLPGGTKNRIDYLVNVGFLTADEKAALGFGWGTLSAGSHPGIPESDYARIGLVLALELGQLLALKFSDWKAHSYAGFSP